MQNKKLRLKKTPCLIFFEAIWQEDLAKFVGLLMERWEISDIIFFPFFGQMQNTSEATGAVSFVSQFRFELAGSHL